MDIKSIFLNGFIFEEVYVKQLPGFENTIFLNYVFKFSKALYSLKQAPRGWYERFSFFLIKNNFMKGKIDTTLFVNYFKNNFLIVQIYVNYIIFYSSNESSCESFAKCVS